MSDDNRETPKELKVSDLPRRRRDGYFDTYANNVSSAMSRYDLHLIFGQITFGPNDEAFIEDRAAITMAWEHVIPFRDLLNRLIAKYEKEQGKIRTFAQGEEEAGGD